MSNLSCSFFDLVPGRALSAVITGQGQNIAAINIHNNEIGPRQRKSLEARLVSFAQACDSAPTSCAGFVVGDFNHVANEDFALDCSIGHLVNERTSAHATGLWKSIFPL